MRISPGKTIKRLYISYVCQCLDILAQFVYLKLTSQWRNEIQKVQNSDLRKILEASRSVPAKIMSNNHEILPINIQIEEIRNQLAIRAIRSMSSRNPVWKLTTWTEILLEPSKWMVWTTTSIVICMSVL